MGTVKAGCERYCELLFPLKGEHSISQLGYPVRDCENTDPQRFTVKFTRGHRWGLDEPRPTTCPLFLRERKISK